MMDALTGWIFLILNLLLGGILGWILRGLYGTRRTVIKVPEGPVNVRLRIDQQGDISCEVREEPQP